MSRGFAIISLSSPKTPENVGGVLRAAQVNISGFRAAKGIHHATNTPAAERHTPIFRVADPLDYIPFGTEVVAVDLIEGATPLQSFRHPPRAVYVFGPEDGTLGHRITSRAQHVVYVPTRDCMNLAACVNVVLYDRLLKGGPFEAAIEGAPVETQAAFYRRAVAA